jgi:hypothetical protein
MWQHTGARLINPVKCLLQQFPPASHLLLRFVVLQEAVLRGRLQVVQLLLRWAPLQAAELRAAVVLASGSAGAVDVVVYLLQQLAAADQGQVLEVLQATREFMDPTQVMFAMVKALHAAAESADGVSAAHAAEARELAEKRLSLQQLITGLAAMQVQQRQGKQQQQVVQEDVRQQDQDDIEISDVGGLWDD